MLEVRGQFFGAAAGAAFGSGFIGSVKDSDADLS